MNRDELQIKTLIFKLLFTINMIILIDILRRVQSRCYNMIII